MALLETTKASIRRHLRYGNIGYASNGAGGGTFGANAGWRYFGEWGDLEARMDSMQPIDEATLLGLPYGLIVLQGLDPNNGDQLVVSLSGGAISSPQTITITSPGETKDSFCQRVACAISQNPVVNAARITVLAPESTGRLGQKTPLTQVELVAQQAFNLAITSMTGNIGASLAGDGTTMTDLYQTIKKVDIYGFLPICNKLYSLIGSASDRMGVDKADVFTARKTEYVERRRAWKQAVDDMADFLVARVNTDGVNGQVSNLSSL